MWENQRNERIWYNWKRKTVVIQISLSARIQIQITNQAIEIQKHHDNYQAAFPFLVIHGADNWQPSALPLLEKMQQAASRAADSPPGINKQTECAVRALRRDTPTENINARGGKRRYRTTLEKSAQKGLAGRRWMMESPSLLGAQCGSNRSRGRCCWRVSECARQRACVC